MTGVLAALLFVIMAAAACATPTLPEGAVRVAIIDGAIDTQLDAFACFDIEQPTDASTAGGHGTAIASVVLGVEDGNCDAPLAESIGVLSYPVLDSSNAGADAESLARAIDDATDAGASIINVSIDLASDQPTLRAAVERALDRGVRIVAAAGNRLGSPAGYPAQYDGVISVGSSSLGEDIAAFSAVEGVDYLFAGVDQPILDTNGMPSTESGTSISSAAVANLLLRALVSGPHDIADLDNVIVPYEVEER